MYTTRLFASKANYTFYFPLCMPLLSFLDLLSILGSSLPCSTEVTAASLVLVLNFKGDVFSVLTIGSIVYFRHPLSFLSQACFYHWYWILSFCVCTYWNMIFLSFILLIRSNTLIHFFHIKTILHSWDKTKDTALSF